ncbi:hypothetical protein A2767_05580 [Candidatus Roizmanbacteria bacterium RIFCSPHIGHO2_01_FULL_35_10]|uniref:Uncharacterized protein n=1 Tax=Candidatus Roizmanbacteria bacterium RIFCSPLOWO2_01_FULL_35_13 TaxID=1802055 RepID=A0A1F7IBM1_9BACT|nr:MAG: hypothetical protein A2767_05580 [Candidatus Roizmanbacteria bacterium RIFCSPHIGHO2_01_FULL_35_10]OGK40763.1 MAG: hypothetical protein A3A74_04050 [Candidatus Roizmanbacteria bacterium RIFCSPLOWO2_01_FULL_35_13]
MADQNQNTQQPNQQPNQLTTQPSERAIKDQIALIRHIDDLIKLRNDPHVTPEKLPAVKTLLLKEINEWINRHLITKLDDQGQIELEKLLNSNESDEELDKFFSQKIPNLQSEIASVLFNFRTAYLYPVRERIAAEAKAKTAQNQTTQNNESSQNDFSDVGPPAPIVNKSN